MHARPTRAESTSPGVLLIGNDELTAVTHSALLDAGARVTNLREDSDPRSARRSDVTSTPSS